MKLITKDLIDLKNNLNFWSITIIFLLHLSGILYILIIFWKIFIYSIIFKFVYFFLISKIKKNFKVSLRFYYGNSVIKNLNCLSSRAAWGLVETLKNTNFKRSGFLSFLIIFLFRAAFILVLGYGLRFILIFFKIINLQINRSYRTLMLKSALTRLKLVFFYLKKDINFVLTELYIPWM